MDVLQLFLLFLCVFHLTLSGPLSKHIDHRNLFTQRVCCKRQSHFVYIGQDISGSPVSVDVGMCRSHCGMATRSSHEARQREYSKHSSMLEFLRSKKMRTRGPSAPEIPEQPSRLPSCRAGQACEPTGMRVERLLLFEGPREVEVIEECHCEIKLSQCVRVPALRTYYFETPYETVIDVGGCSRSKGGSEGFSCVPTKFDSALLETPNKGDVIRTVAACELRESCYRVPFVEYYYETVQHTDGVKEERLKEIDVGRCLGGCTTGNRCLFRSPSDPENCHLWSERPSGSCVPQGYQSHSFINQHGQIRTILSITSCFCQN
uniref:Pinhead n=1 Tax=Fundulus heteroclitus TaxID=8078 RepID=A0A3Q2P934_FUNHE